MTFLGIVNLIITIIKVVVTAKGFSVVHRVPSSSRLTARCMAARKWKRP